MFSIKFSSVSASLPLDLLDGGFHVGDGEVENAIQSPKHVVLDHRLVLLNLLRPLCLLQLLKDLLMKLLLVVEDAEDSVAFEQARHRLEVDLVESAAALEDLLELL